MIHAELTELLFYLFDSFLGATNYIQKYVHDMCLTLRWRINEGTGDFQWQIYKWHPPVSSVELCKRKQLAWGFTVFVPSWAYINWTTVDSTL